ncbi:hypothetical protein E2C01_087156 [Portunus trituberculatus]|uniref:Uncharacterized protein n=1 Tax=Portunus trituberculatus TaxID=210409 RepID=A0A5B7JIB2_PORTR|nr:hypothetical protein [Portunus trituberculatus]
MRGRGAGLGGGESGSRGRVAGRLATSYKTGNQRLLLRSHRCRRSTHPARPLPLPGPPCTGRLPAATHAHSSRYLPCPASIGAVTLTQHWPGRGMWHRGRSCTFGMSQAPAETARRHALPRAPTLYLTEVHPCARGSKGYFGRRGLVELAWGGGGGG